MAAVSTPAPAPEPFTTVRALVAASGQASRGPHPLAQSAREALADVASILRNVRYDMTRPTPKDGPRFTEEYAIELGMRVLQVADAHFDMQARDWDGLIKALNGH